MAVWVCLALVERNSWKTPGVVALPELGATAYALILSSAEGSGRDKPRAFPSFSSPSLTVNGAAQRVGFERCLCATGLRCACTRDAEGQVMGFG